VWAEAAVMDDLELATDVKFRLAFANDEFMQTQLGKGLKVKLNWKQINVKKELQHYFPHYITRKT